MTAKKNPLLSKSESLSESWKARLDFTDGLAGTPFHNSWRAIIFTIKGKKIGSQASWSRFASFKEDMYLSYQPGMRLFRFDKTKPFSKENCRWVLPDDIHTSKIIKFEYEGQTKTLKEWCLEYDLSYNGVRQRYHKGKNYSPREILFGKLKKPKRELMDQASLDAQDLRNKASKMISAHRCRDKKRGFVSNYELPVEWFIVNILKKTCVYCGTDKYLGADRIDNSKPHTQDNIQPCCARCNGVKGDKFSHDEMLKIGAFIRDNL